MIDGDVPGIGLAVLENFSKMGAGILGIGGGISFSFSSVESLIFSFDCLCVSRKNESDFVDLGRLGDSEGEGGGEMPGGEPRFDFLGVEVADLIDLDLVNLALGRDSKTDSASASGVGALLSSICSSNSLSFVFLVLFSFFISFFLMLFSFFMSFFFFPPSLR
jgi:hypothetical protein